MKSLIVMLLCICSVTGVAVAQSPAETYLYNPVALQETIAKQEKKLENLYVAAVLVYQLRFEDDKAVEMCQRGLKHFPEDAKLKELLKESSDKLKK